MKRKTFIVIAIFVIFACNSQCINGLRILGLFPLHGKSHFVMPERLMKGLVERGHKVDVYSHFPQKKSLPNYNDFSLAGTMPGIVNNVSYEFFKEFQTPDAKKMLELVGNPVCELMDTPVFRKLFETLKTRQPYDVVIIEVFMSNCFLAWGRYLDIPMVGVMTSALIDWYNEPLGNPVNLAATPGSWSEFFHPMNFWERLSNFFLYHMILAQFNYHMKVQNKYVEKYFGSGYPDASELPKDIDLLLVNTHYAIEGIRPYTPAIVPIAGLHVVDDGTKLPKEVQKWLDESKAGCIYISFGSMVRIETFPKPTLDAFYAAFKNIAPVRVLMKIAKPEELPPGLPANVMTQSWFSQIQVLRHKNMRAFITHGGLASSLESTYAGVPLIGIPLFGDQHINVRQQVRRKNAVMIQLDNLTEETLTHAMREVLNNPIYKKNIEKFSKEINDRPMEPMDTAAFWIEYIVRHGKKSLRSPIVDMPWYQAKLIDVYGLILLILIVIIYILKFVLKTIRNLCSTPRDQKKIKRN